MNECTKDIRKDAEDLIEKFKKSKGEMPFNLYATVNIEIIWKEGDIHNCILTIDACDPDELKAITENLTSSITGEIKFCEVFIEYYDEKEDNYMEFRLQD
ncbi:MAG: hypothetical protein ACE5K4_02580 [Candidatus Hydrothermarchaeota archaeon]